MKKFLSMVMAAAMVVSLVPATAFAAASDDVRATAKVVNAKNYTEKEIGSGAISGPELQLYYTTADYATSDAGKAVYTVTLDNAEFDSVNAPKMYIKDDNQNVWAWTGTGYGTQDPFGVGGSIKATVKFVDDDELEITVDGKMYKGWTLAIDLKSDMDKTSKGKVATVSVDSDDVVITNGDDLTYASVEDKNIKASVKKAVDVATEEIATIEDVKIEPAVGKDFAAIFGDGADRNGKEIKLKLNSGFEFVVDSNAKITDSHDGHQVLLNTTIVEDDEIVIELGTGKPGVYLCTGTSEKYTISGLKVEATSAKAGSTATMRVYATGCDTVSVEVAKVVDYTVSMTVDEDEDVPVIYSGVDVENTGIVDDSTHEALEVTIKESFAGAWNNSKDFTLSLPEGVYVADTLQTATDGDFFLKGGTTPSTTKMTDWFEGAYKEGDYETLTFERRTWDETNPDGPNDDPAEVSFILTLVADPNFEGDVVLKLEGDAVETQEVTIAKFVKPFTVEAQQNDMQIDYRNTEIPTSVVIKEAEAGLWDKKTVFKLSLDKILFDDEGTIKVDEKSGLELKDDKVKVDSEDNIYFEVSSRSDDEPATVTISGLQLYMQRSLPAGAYDLDVYSPTMLADGMQDDGTFTKAVADDNGYLNQGILRPATETVKTAIDDINEDFVSYTAKAGFVNIVTAGREDTDSFTTKVVVPVGESYLISGENKVEIPVPAYINAAGYTMLPLRAVAVALGINENNVLWDQSTRTATVMYGSKIINMTYGQKVVYVNAAPIPASTSVEIKENRMFLGLRDLGTALGVTDITWDGATKTATLNGNK